MGFKNLIKKSVAFVSSIAMTLSMVAMPATATFAEESSDGLQLSKNIELQEDGNYKITLEAYATGKDTTTTTEKAVPLDIVLVLDQSGSMADSFTSSVTYSAIGSQEYNYSNYKDKKYYYKDGDQYYQVKRGSEGGKNNKTYYLYYTKDGKTYYLSSTGVTTTRPTNVTSNSTTIWTGVLYTRTSTSTTRLAALKSAVTNFVTTVEQNAATNKVDHRIAMVGFASESGYGNNTEVLSVSGTNSGSVGVIYDSNNGDSYTNATKNAFQDTTKDAGKTMLTNAINALAADGATRTDLGMEIAEDILAADAKKDETGRKKLVIMFTDGTPTTQSSFSSTVANSAISTSETIKSSGKVYSIGIFDGADPSSLTSDENKFMNYVSTNYPNASSMTNPGTASNTGYYKAASSADELNSIFESISDSETSSSTTVTLNEESVLRDIISDNFELPQGSEDSSVTVYIADSDKVSADGSVTWNDKIKVNNSVSINGKIVDVSGFNYSENYVTANHPGKKLIVEILVNGLLSGKELNSNNAISGIYENKDATTAVQCFEQPKVDIPEYSYVLDYGKKVSLPNVDTNTKNIHDSTQNKNYSSTTKMNLSKAAPTDSTELKDNYGTFKLENSTLTYQPGKINWDGFDSIFTFGTKSDNSYEWYKTNVIPATSVYYEDDFGTDDNTDSNVAIVWTGKWQKEGISENEQQSSENSKYGWDESYKNDTEYSNGSAHVSSEKGASAKFKFTGTGVDVYSRTNDGVGKILASIKKVVKQDNGDETLKSIKTLAIDNLSVSGDYYQIPTLNFDDLEYGTYEVTIKVVPLTSESRGKYYLDGIRVYNPLGTVDADSTEGKAYEEAGESNAQYISVRKGLLDNTNVDSITASIEGSVFIDKSEDKVGDSTSDIGTYETYGPKNEVYLKENHGVAFNIKEYNSSNKVFIGLKSPTGKEVTVKVTSGDKVETIALSSAADLYYEITPDEDGNIVIQNTTNNLLSVTKVRITSSNSSDKTYSLISTPALMTYVSKFDTLSVKEDTTQKDEETTLDKDDVDIDNLGDVTESEENTDSSKDNNQTKQDSIWTQIASSIKNWFRR